MKRFFLFMLSVLFAAALFMACSVDDPEPVTPTPAAGPAPTEEETAAQADENIIEKHPPSGFPDSAFFRPESFDGMPYQIIYPRKYDASKSYPLVIFLHGMDERGTDNQKQLRWGSSLFLSDSISTKYPAFVIFPQCPPSYSWNDPFVQANLKALIDNVVRANSVDANRIYIEGLSMGAYGTYAMVATYPDLFAAAIAISGDGDKTKAPRMANVAWKIYGGDKDTIVPGERSKKMAEALRNAGASVSLKIYPGANHVDTWVRAFAEPDYSSWIFSMTKESQ